MTQLQQAEHRKHVAAVDEARKMFLATWENEILHGIVSVKNYTQAQTINIQTACWKCFLAGKGLTK